MKNNGFTLVELLAVIVILAIILAISVPSISNVIESTTKSAFEIDAQMILKQLEYEKIKNAGFDFTLVTQETIDDYNMSNTNYDNLKIELVDGNPYITIIGKNRWAGLKVCGTYQNMTATDVDDTEVCVPTVDAALPMATGTIPVYYDEAAGVWKKADVSNEGNNWFDYDNFKWANIVTVSPDGSGTGSDGVTRHNRSEYLSAAVGTPVSIDDMNTMWVWIPRYKYRIPAGTGAREIDVVLEDKTTPKSTGDAIATYYTHPAFTFGTEELDGIWVAKFETNGTEARPLAKPGTDFTTDLNIKRSFESYRSMIGNSEYGFPEDSDLHMMKNTEWGAVAYLSQSKYGKYGNPAYTGANKEIYPNNSQYLYVGRSSGAPGGSAVVIGGNQYNLNGYYTYDGKCATIDVNLPAPCNSGSPGQVLSDKTLGYGASTTGTIYGIYDMVGGLDEYVMGMYKPTIPTGLDYSGYSSPNTLATYNLLTVDAKYYDAYLYSSSFDGTILGDATGETETWYNDFNRFIASNTPWFARGGGYNNGADVGIFTYFRNSGASGSTTSRIVLIP